MSDRLDTNTALCAHLHALEAALLSPELRRDRAQVGALLAEDFLEFGSSGSVWTREQILDLLATEDYLPPAMKDFQCHLLAEEVALVTYRTMRINAQTGQNKTVLRSSVWTLVAGDWRVRFHQGTRSI